MEERESATLTHRLVSGLQWGLSAHLLLLLLSGLLVDILPELFNRVVLYGGTALAFAYGYGKLTSSIDVENSKYEHDFRVEYIVSLIIFMVGIAYGVIPLLQKTGLDSAFDIYLTDSLSFGTLMFLLSPIILAYISAYVAEIGIYSNYISKI